MKQYFATVARGLEALALEELVSLGAMGLPICNPPYGKRLGAFYWLPENILRLHGFIEELDYV